MIPKIMSYFGLNSLGTLLGVGGEFMAVYIRELSTFLSKLRVLFQF